MGERYAYFLDLPVYRCSPERHRREAELASSRKQRWIEEHGGAPPCRAPRTYADAHNATLDDYGPWQFNQIVGWLRLYARRSHVGAHLWWVDARRIRYKMKYKRYGLVTLSNVLATHFDPSAASDAIFQEVVASLRALECEPPLKGRHLDLSLLTHVGPQVDWRGLLDGAT